MPASAQIGIAQPARLDVLLTHVVYALQALSVALAFSFADELSTWLLSAVPSIIGALINYWRRGAVAETFLASHRRWQVSTFRYAVLWIAVAILLSLPLMPLLIGFVTATLAGMAVIAWVLYRVIRGSIQLFSGLPTT